MQTSTSTVAIIGAGPGGLVSAKEMLACGITPTIFEKGETIGGQWSAEGAVWDNMVLNNSRKGSTFSDFEWEAGSPDFPNREQVYKYLFSYATKFNIHQYVQLHAEVTKIEEEENHSGWHIQWLQGKEQKEGRFDFVNICSGFFSKAYIPEIRGMESFQGTITHSKNFKKIGTLKGKKVVIIGNAYSGCEIAVAATNQEPSSLTHIFRKEKFIVPRYVKPADSEEKFPIDAFISRSMVYSHQDYQERNIAINSFLLNTCKEQAEIPELAVSGKLTDPAHVTISEGYVTAVKEKKIHLKKGFIKHIERDTLFLSDDTSFKVDHLIFCTGYRTTLPFLNEKIKNDIEFDETDPLQPVILHLGTLHPKYPRLGFTGLVRLGIYPGALEAQARVISLIFSKQILFPDEQTTSLGMEMQRTIKGRSPRPQAQGYIPFTDDVAKLGHFYPEESKIGPELYHESMNGPYRHESYRWTGPGSNRELNEKKMDATDGISQKNKPIQNAL